MTYFCFKLGVLSTTATPYTMDYPVTQVYGKMDKDPDRQEDRIFHTFQGLRTIILGNIHNWPVMDMLPALQENHLQFRASISKTTTIYTILISQETVVPSGLCIHLRHRLQKEYCVEGGGHRITKERKSYTTLEI